MALYHEILEQVSYLSAIYKVLLFKVSKLMNSTGGVKMYQHVDLKIRNAQNLGQQQREMGQTEDSCDYVIDEGDYDD